MVVSQIIDAWNSSVVEVENNVTGKSKDFFKKANSQIVKKLLEAEEKILQDESKVVLIRSSEEDDSMDCVSEDFDFPEVVFHEDVEEIAKSNEDGKEYGKHYDMVNKKMAPARGHHGAMHCVRVALWTQVLSKVYQKLGREKIDNPILLATAGAFHDVAREDEGIDYWDNESSEALEKLLKHDEVDDVTTSRYVQTIREKDPKDGQFSTDMQRIVHDADCLDIIRVVGKWNFSKKFLCFVDFDDKQKTFCDQLVNEIADFISITEDIKVRNHLEHNSNDFYGDLVRLLFELKIEGKSRFPLITGLVRDDMREVLEVENAESFKTLLSILKL